METNLSARSKETTHMKTQTLVLKLNSPAFLGDANQSSVWRTPPIKGLLREWWRIASAPSFNYKHETMREAEGRLFGNAWLKDQFCKSQVRIALQHWRAGTMHQHIALAKIPHPEAEKAGKMVEPLNYLGYGPIDKGRFKNGAALQAGEKNSLDLAYPVIHQERIEQTLLLIDWFGTIGGRSRNAWGSLALAQEPLTPNHPQLKSILREIKDCLRLDWPHAIGQDETGALLWESKDSFADWKEAMTFLAKTKIAFRTHLGFTTGKRSSQIEGRHIVAYPVTNHDVSDWGGQARIANQLRFKLFSDPGQGLRARIYHTPHRCPLPSGMREGLELAVWQKIHRWLDDQNSLQRLGAKK